MSRSGVVYLVAGPRSYLGELATSLGGLSRHSPDLPVTVFSPYELPRGAAAQLEPYHSDLHPLQQKVDILRRSPYEHTLFLDTDTTILGDVGGLFDIAPDDFVAAKAYRFVDTDDGGRRLELEHPNNYNTGVLCFPASLQVRGFLDEWYDTVLAQDPADMWPGHNCDQTWFNRLVAGGAPDRHGMRLVTAPNRVYNCRGVMADEVRRRGQWGDVKVFHHRTRAMKARKAVYSMGDREHLTEAARRVAAKARARLRR